MKQEEFPNSIVSHKFSNLQFYSLLKRIVASFARKLFLYSLRFIILKIKMLVAKTKHNKNGIYKKFFFDYVQLSIVLYVKVLGKFGKHAAHRLNCQRLKESERTRKKTKHAIYARNIIGKNG